MCGILGVITPNDEVFKQLYVGLLALQHRGQDAAGMVTWDGKRFYDHKNTGLVEYAFKGKTPKDLPGHQGIGHVRYVTHGEGFARDAQPFLLQAPYGIAMAHNGNVTNYGQLEKELRIAPGCDLETILHIFNNELIKRDFKRRVKADPNITLMDLLDSPDELLDIEELTDDDIFKATGNLMKRVQGAYSVIASIAGKGLLAFRDPYGIRPLIWGKKESTEAISHAFASESRAFDTLGYDVLRDLKPGEAVLVKENGNSLHRQVAQSKGLHTCIFEYIYFALADSVIDGQSVSQARHEMGVNLADRVKEAGIMPDVVIDTPNTSTHAARATAKYFGMIPYRQGFIKNNYVIRTFIMAQQWLREFMVDIKLNVDKAVVFKKKILDIDDCIVRGTTGKKLVSKLRQAEATEVYLGSSAPPIKHTCPYGIDMSTEGELIAAKKSIPEIQEELGADALIYQNLEDLGKCVPRLDTFCDACFSGTYPTGISAEDLAKISGDRRAVKSISAQQKF